MDNKTNKPTYEELEAQLAAAISAERVWETAMMAACGEDGPASVAEKFAQLEAQVKQIGAEAAQMKTIIDSVTDLDNEPQFHEQGMGCGLEDRGITDRYDAMRHGWDQAMERVYGEVIPCAEELSFPATDAFLSRLRNEHRAEGAHFAANRMLAAWEAGFIEDTPESAADIARMIIASTEFMADAPEGDFDRTFADGVLEDITNMLREGKAGEVQS